MDYLIKIDTASWTESCTAMSYSQEILTIKAKSNIEQFECDYGIMGMFTNDWNDCFWSKYYIDMPFYELAPLKQLNFKKDWTPEECKQTGSSLPDMADLIDQ